MGDAGSASTDFADDADDTGGDADGANGDTDDDADDDADDAAASKGFLPCVDRCDNIEAAIGLRFKIS